MEITKYLRYCRVCAKKKDLTRLLPLAGNELHMDIAQKIATTLHLQFTVDDCLPQEICHQCLSRVEIGYSFITSCKRSQQKLMQMAFNGFNFQETLCRDKKNTSNTLFNLNKISIKNETSTINKKDCITMNIFDEVPVIEHVHVKEEDNLKREEENYDDDDNFENEKIPEEHASKDLTKEATEKNHQCPQCDKQFHTASGLKFHSESFHGSSNYICELCGKEFGHKTTLNGHMRVHLPDVVKKLFHCSICDKRFPTRYQLKEHLNTHYDLRTHVCPTCDKSFNRSIYLRAHLATHRARSATVFYCSQCGDRPFYCRRLLVRHMRRHEAKIVCRICDENFETYAERKIHSRQKHTQDDMRDRMKNCDKNSKVAVECNVCQKVLSKFSLRKHMKTHAQLDEDVTCEVCGKRLKSSKSLNYHFMTFHSGQEGRWKCKFCEAAFMSKDLRTRHEYKHTGETPYKCTQCDKGFRSSGSLRQHGLVHETASEKHTCTVCDKQFKRKAALDVHRRKHTGDLPFKCSACDRRFAQKNDRDKHEFAIHWKVCPICSTQFTSTAESKVHFAECSKSALASKDASTTEFISSSFVETAESSFALERRDNHEPPLLEDVNVVQYLCTACNVTFDSEQRLENHFLRYHGQRLETDGTVEAVHFEYSL